MWLGRWVNSVRERGRREPGLRFEVNDEPTFRHFLMLERKRAERRGRSLLLVLIDLGVERHPHRDASVDAIVFGVLETCVRESDFIGWYESMCVAGAVLVQGERPPTPAVCREIGERAAALLKARLPSHVITEVRVLQLDANREERHA